MTTLTDAFTLSLSLSLFLAALHRNESKEGVYVCCVHKMRCLLKAQLYYLVRYYPSVKDEKEIKKKMKKRRSRKEEKRLMEKP